MAALNRAGGIEMNGVAQLYWTAVDLQSPALERNVAGAESECRFDRQSAAGRQRSSATEILGLFKNNLSWANQQQRCVAGQQICLFQCQRSSSAAKTKDIANSGNNRSRRHRPGSRRSERHPAITQYAEVDGQGIVGDVDCERTGR